MRIAFFIPVAVLLYACQGTPLVTRTCSPPEGRHVNVTLLEGCRGMLEAARPFFAVELRFRDSAAVVVDNGFEQFPLKVTYDRGGCSGRLGSATQFGDMPFTIDKDGRILLMDTAWTKLDKPSVFTRSLVEQRTNWGFREHLNACVFEFPYINHVDGKPQPGRVEMLSNGQMSGMSPFVGYTLCFAGDCQEEAEPFMPTITFVSYTGETATYGMDMSDGGHRIRFYTLAPPMPDVKGSRQVGEMAFEWLAE